MYYEGLNSNEGLMIQKEDAFGYAMDVLTKDEEVFQEFCEAFDGDYIGNTIRDIGREAFLSFAKTFTEWFFSGDWLLRKGGADE